MIENLKPCPFCGHDAVARSIGVGGEVICSNCSAIMGPKLSFLSVIEDWNRREIDIDALLEVVDELECAYRPEDYASVDELCELANDAGNALAKCILEAVGMRDADIANATAASEGHQK